MEKEARLGKLALLKELLRVLVPVRTRGGLSDNIMLLIV